MSQPSYAQHEIKTFEESFQPHAWKLVLFRRKEELKKPLDQPIDEYFMKPIDPNHNYSQR